MPIARVIDATRNTLRFTAHGIAEYLESTPVRQRSILQDYLFPDESKPKIVQRQPARQLAQQYFLSGCDPTVLHDAIDRHSRRPFNEKAHARARRLSALEVANVLPRIAEMYNLTGESIGNRLSIPISGLIVGASIDLIATNERTKRTVAVIFNTAAYIAKTDSKLKHYAKLHCEVALRALRTSKTDVAEVWYIDLCSGRRIRAQSTEVQPNWRNIEVACDKILIEARELLRRRERVATVTRI